MSKWRLVKLPKGSSPHTRGLPLQCAGLVYRGRIIPAYAGPTFFSLFIWFNRKDHPRIRGAYSSSLPFSLSSSGSSPHTRGLLFQSVRASVAPRIIPAYAGPTGWSLHKAAEMGDHPRIRGAYQKKLTGTLRTFGSSPHTRGLPRLPSF